MIQTGYKFRNGNILVVRYDGEIVLEEGEHWVTSKDNPKHHFVVNKKGEITKGLGGMRPITKEFVDNLPPASVIEWDGNKYIQIGDCVDLHELGHEWGENPKKEHYIAYKLVGEHKNKMQSIVKEMPSMARVISPVDAKTNIGTKCRALENFPSKELIGGQIVQAVCDFTPKEQQEIKEHLARLFKDNAMCMAINPEFLDKAMDTHFANQVELKGSHGVAYLPEVRKELEKEAFGTGLDVPGYERPKYGYLAPKDFAKDSGRQETYGTATVQFKDIGEVTYTFGDSVDDFDYPKSLVSAGLVSKPSLAGLPIIVGNHHEDNYKNPKEKILDVLRSSRDACEVARKLGIDYIELQYHGKVTADNVKAICYTEGDLPSKERVQQYKQKGIDIKVKTMDGKVIPYKEGIENKLLRTREERKFVNYILHDAMYNGPDFDEFSEEQQERIMKRMEQMVKNGNGI